MALKDSCSNRVSRKRSAAFGKQPTQNLPTRLAIASAAVMASVRPSLKLASRAKLNLIARECQPVRRL